MALLWIDGHTSYLPAGSLAGVYSTISGTVSVESAAGPNGERAIKFVARSYVNKAVPTIASGTTATIGGRFSIPALPPGSMEILVLAEGSTPHLSVHITTTGTLVLRRGSLFTGTALGTSAGTVPVGSYFTVELQATVHDTTGTATVRLNGVDVITFGPGDTRNGGSTGAVDTAYWGNFFGSTSAAAIATVAYPYVTDGTGSAHTGYLGTLNGVRLAVTGAGTYAEGTTSGGAAWDAVDEVPYNTADNIMMANAGERFTFTAEDVTAASGIAAAVVHVRADGNGLGLAAYALRGGSAGQGDTTTLASAAQNRVSAVSVDPSTSAAWTDAGVSAAEWGVIRTGAAGGNLRVYQLGIEVFSTGAISVGAVTVPARVINPVIIAAW